MTKENYELNLLSSVLKTLIDNSDPTEIINILERIFNRFGRASNKFVELKKINIYIYDDNTKTLRDYSKSWIEIDRTKNPYNERLYLVITQLSQFSFFVNGKPYKMEELVDFSSIAFNNGDNTILFPLKRGHVPFGILELQFPHSIENLLDSDFFMMLSIASYQISLKIQNAILAEQMQKNIDFHKAMKDIAKTIESQYELDYIMPIIGEMIDRFVSNHLIYVYLATEEADSKFRLVWPNACRDESVTKILDKIGEGNKAVYENDGKVAAFPLVGKKLFGCIVAHSSSSQLSEKEIDYLEQLCKQSSITIQRANAYAEVLQHATLDALTGLNNRRQFESRLKQEVASAERQRKPLCAMMLDIDFFKKVNDTYGHIAGDCVLKSFSTVIKKSIRESDIASRYGGEEFVVLLPFTNIAEAQVVAERFRQAVEANMVDVVNEKDGSILTISVTASIGLYEYADGDSPQMLYQKADEALYQAKTRGRNQVFISEELQKA